MTDDLVGRLRNRADLETKCGNRTKSPFNAAVLLSEAAARIEALEAALRRIAEMHRGKPAHDIARAALTPEPPHAD